MKHRRILGPMLATVVLVAGACGGDDGDKKQAGSAAGQLVGLFKIDAGECTHRRGDVGQFVPHDQPRRQAGRGPVHLQRRFALR